MGDVPLFAMAPKDFSSRLEMPAAILAGIGLILRISSPVALALSSQCLAAERIFLATLSFTARLATRSSAPIISVVSEKNAVPPTRIS